MCQSFGKQYGHGVRDFVNDGQVIRRMGRENCEMQ